MHTTKTNPAFSDTIPNQRPQEQTRAGRQAPVVPAVQPVPSILPVLPQARSTPAVRPLQADEPAWRKAFIAADGVRYTRTPDRVLQERSGRVRPEAAVQTKGGLRSGPVPAPGVEPELVRPVPAPPLEVKRAEAVVDRPLSGGDIEDEWTLAESAWADLIEEARVDAPASEAVDLEAAAPEATEGQEG